MMPTSSRHVIALSVKASDPGSRYEWALDRGLALEYTPDPERLDRLSLHTGVFHRRKIPVRYHARYFGLEFGDARPEKAERAFAAHRRTLDAVASAGGSVLTVHAGLTRGVGLDFSTLEVNLKHLAAYGQDRGVAVCLENLRSGPASDSDNVLRWASFAGAAITLDVGHVVSSDAVKEGAVDGAAVARKFAPLLREVHFYGEEEDDRHWPLSEMGRIAPLADVAVEAGVRWWTVELEEYSEALSTVAVLTEYLEGRGELLWDFTASTVGNIAGKGKGKL